MDKKILLQFISDYYNMINSIDACIFRINEIVDNKSNFDNSDLEIKQTVNEIDFNLKDFNKLCDFIYEISK